MHLIIHCIFYSLSNILSIFNADTIQFNTFQLAFQVHIQRSNNLWFLKKIQKLQIEWNIYLYHQQKNSTCYKNSKLQTMEKNKKTQIPIMHISFHKELFFCVYLFVFILSIMQCFYFYHTNQHTYTQHNIFGILTLYYIFSEWWTKKNSRINFSFVLFNFRCYARYRSFYVSYQV